MDWKLLLKESRMESQRIYKCPVCREIVSSTWGSCKCGSPESRRRYEDFIGKEPELTAKDVQIGGNHYKDLSIQPGDYIRENKLGWYEGNVIKYITRHDKKNGLEDVMKAKHYIEMIIEEYKSK